MLFLLWFSTTVGEGRLWQRLRIYSGKLFNYCYKMANFKKFFSVKENF
jgi:hypothetical protein